MNKKRNNDNVLSAYLDECKIIGYEKSKVINEA
jgi:hypothetical protein